MPPATLRRARPRWPTQRIRPPPRPPADRHRPRLPGQRQQPRGQGHGRGGLDGEDLRDAGCSGPPRHRLRRRFSGAGIRHGPRRSDHRPPRHRDRRRGNTSACSSPWPTRRIRPPPRPRSTPAPRARPTTPPRASPSRPPAAPRAMSVARLRLVRALLGARRLPHRLAALSDGAHTFEVRATDPARNTDATPAAAPSRSTPPPPTPRSTPAPRPRPTTTPSFGFSATGGATELRMPLRPASRPLLGTRRSPTPPRQSSRMAPTPLRSALTDSAQNTDTDPVQPEPARSTPWPPRPRSTPAPRARPQTTTPSFAFSASEWQHEL